MAKRVRDVMSTNVVAVSLDAPLVEVARIMRDHDVGDVLISDGSQLQGILTDRDITVRAVAEALDPERTTVDAVFSGQELATIGPDARLDAAEQVMRERAIRRLPVVEQGQPVGIVSLGDLARRRDEGELLADIASAPPNE